MSGQGKREVVYGSKLTGGDNLIDLMVKDGGVLRRVVIPSEVRVVVERGAKVVIEECTIEGREIPCQPFVVPK